MRNFMSNRVKGFTILELSIVLVIASVLITGFFSFTVNKTIDSAIKSNDDKLKLIDEAITKFYITNGYIPCPAPHTTAIGATGFGVSAAPCTSAVAGTDDVGTIKIGTVPVRTLNLPDSFMFDQWGNRIRYGMVRVLGVDAAGYTAANPGAAAISVIDGSGNSMIPNLTTLPPTFTISDHVAYVVISHGPNSTGAYNYNGAQPIGCSGGGLDVENCDINTTFRHSPFVTNSYDDSIRWSTRQILSYKRSIETKSALSSYIIPNPTEYTYLVYHTYGDWVQAGIPLPAVGWHQRRFNAMPVNDALVSFVGTPPAGAGDSLTPFSDPSSPYARFDNQVTVPAGTYYLKATSNGCRILGHMVRIRTTGGTLLAVGSAAYAGEETTDCNISEAVGVATFAAPTAIMVESYVTNLFSGNGGADGWGMGTPNLMGTPGFPTTGDEPYASVTLEIQKWD
jgi:prepilin-type N-terminal cleavage/methylation domain-containing protein